MFCSPKTPALRRYRNRVGVVMSSYCLLLPITVFGFRHYHLTGLAAYALAVLPALPILAVMIVVGLYLAEEKDEFWRNYLQQVLLWAIGPTLAVTTVWGFLENFAKAPHLDLYLVFPIYCVFVGIATVLIKLKYR
jgi:hypothetical protein